MPVIALLAAALGAEPAWYDGDVAQALTLLARDADVDPADVRPAPLWFGGRLEVVGELPAVACDAPVSGMAFASALRDAERWAVAGELDAAGRALDGALDALPCLDVPVRGWEAAAAYDLASALVTAGGGPTDDAVRLARQALALEPGRAFAYQVDADVLGAASREVGAPSVLWLPPGAEAGRVLVDGRPVTAASVALTPGRHLVQALGEGVTTLALDVPDAPCTAALVTPEARALALDLEEADARAWLRGALPRWGPLDRPAWLVVRDRVWRLEGDAWSRYDRRPPRAVRPALLSVLGVATGGAVAGAAVAWARFDALGRCGTADAGAGCGPFQDATSGLIVDADGWGAARGRASTWGFAAAGAAVVAGGTLGVVAARARAPRAVRVGVVPAADGATVAVGGTWGPR